MFYPTPSCSVSYHDLPSHLVVMLGRIDVLSHTRAVGEIPRRDTVQRAPTRRVVSSPLRDYATTGAILLLLWCHSRGVMRAPIQTRC